MSDISRPDLVALTLAKKGFALVARGRSGLREVCFQGDDLAEACLEAQKPDLDAPRLYKCVDSHWSQVKNVENPPGVKKAAKKAKP